MRSKKAKTAKAAKTTTRLKTPPAVNKTIVSFLLDETSSMSSILEKTLEGFNSYVSELKDKIEGETYFSLVKFNSRHTTKVQVGVAINEIAALSKDNYKPYGYTPLVDAAVKTIVATEEISKLHPDAKVIVVVQTDGGENSSTEFTRSDLRRLIAQKEELGWQFVFIGAGIDAYAEASAFGFKPGSTIAYDPGATVSAFGNLASSTVQYANSVVGTPLRASGVTFGAAQKMSVGDRFYNPDADAKDLAERLKKAKVDNAS